jgi:hypothetical protein
MGPYRTNAKEKEPVAEPFNEWRFHLALALFVTAPFIVLLIMCAIMGNR